MKVRIYGPWARARKGLFGVGINIDTGGMAFGLGLWIVIIYWKESNYGCN